ncbi:MAG: hypothetical protein M3275_04385 [Thermoproteota archaeon]|nr:hypothetical protein [Thermoproteota archaeon]
MVKAAKQAHIATEELRQDPYSDITTVVKEEEYRSIVKEALTYYLAALEKSTKIVQEKLGAGSSSSKPILAHYNNEIRLANNLKQSVSEATP